MRTTRVKRPPDPSLLLKSPEAFHKALTWYLVERPHAHYELASGPTTYRFYLFRSERYKGQRFVACKIVRRPRFAAIDEYGRRVARRRACRECGKVFDKAGRREFCSAQCGARQRKRKFKTGDARPPFRRDPRKNVYGLPDWTEPTEAQIWKQDAIERPDRH